MYQQRSAIPRVIGIVALVFAPMGIFFSLTWVLGAIYNHRAEDMTPWQPLITWLWVTVGLTVLVFGLHLLAGITAVMYKPSAPRWMTIYGIVALVVAALRFAVPLTLMPPGFAQDSQIVQELVFLQVGYAMFAAPWPILALILMNLRSSRAACQRMPAQDLGQVFT